MWDPIVSVPDHCLSVYSAVLIHVCTCTLQAGRIGIRSLLVRYPVEVVNIFKMRLLLCLEQTILRFHGD